jgi:membrane-associated phospholipid phosphatase
MSLPAGCSGEALPLQVTLPNDPNFWQILSVIYGYVPWALCLGIALLFLIYRGSRELTLGLLPALTAGINELVKLGVNQPRPAGSCLTSKGMPSSHSAVAIGLFLFLVLDAGYRLRPTKPMQSCIFGSLASTGLSVVNMLKGGLMLPVESLSQHEFFGYLAIWSVLLLPVPVSRVLLNDHSPSQALAGMLVGMLAVGLWFPLTLWMRSSWREHVGEKYLAIFKHNYDVPEGWREQPVDGETDPIVGSKNRATPNDIV